jgi:symplekin
MTDADFMCSATSRPPQAIFELFNMSKSRILSLALDPHAQPNNKGVKAAAWKFVQKVLLAGIRAPAMDPRVS